jgi:hypothetical protein
MFLIIDESSPMLSGQAVQVARLSKSRFVAGVTPAESKNEEKALPVGLSSNERRSLTVRPKTAIEARS